MIFYTDRHKNRFYLFLSFLGTFIVAFGSGIYLIANLGPGTRDGLMTGIAKNYNKPISLIRFSIEFLVIFLLS